MTVIVLARNQLVNDIQTILELCMKLGYSAGGGKSEKALSSLLKNKNYN